MNKALKYTLIFSPIALGGYLVYYVIKHYMVPAKTPLPNTNGVLPKTNNTGGTSAATAGCTFPLTVGSNNACVGQLQDVLGINIDNNFSTSTLTALYAQTGKSQITNAEDLSATEDMILDQDGANLSANTAASNALILQWGTSDPNFIRMVNTIAWREVVQDGNGNWISAGYQINATKGLNFSCNDYKLFSSDPATGNLLINCNKGVNEGYWSVDPTYVKLV